MLVLREQGKVQKQIAEREIRRLQAEGFSQREIARRTNVSRRQLRDILSGRRGVGEKTIAAVIESRKTGQAMLLLRDYGSVWVQPANAANRSLLGSYWHALGVARETGDRSLLEKFKNRTVTVIERGRRGRLKLVTDPAILGRLEDQHQLAPKEVTHYDLRRAKRGRGE
jgi:lambda repressor-like predicted transcriptional regulator